MARSTFLKPDRFVPFATRSVPDRYLRIPAATTSLRAPEISPAAISANDLDEVDLDVDAEHEDKVCRCIAGDSFEALSAQDRDSCQSARRRPKKSVGS